MKNRTRLFLLCAMLAMASVSGCSSGAPAPAETQVTQEALQDGTYSVAVTLEGGSGRASIESPAEITRQDGKFTARIVWSSNHYDYMMVGDTRYEPVSTDPVSVFEIPVDVFDEPIAVQADTTAMSTAHLIDYTLTFNYNSLFNNGVADDSGNSGNASSDGSRAAEDDNGRPTETQDFTEATGQLTPSGQMELQYAKKFTVDYYQEGHALITIAGVDRFLLVPEGGVIPTDLAADVKVLQQPLNNIYLAASSAMDLFRQLGALDQVSMTSTDEWSIPEIADCKMKLHT